ncbi:CD209 antigen-like protein D DC-SIGN-related protein 3 [Takifugu flavidus]|uniref:CD209 antigen-like protein D DC-SIGN-related protein 3 n=1 Tax=Takifugu flavidus TaxID=433684 RepID=A0A5C6MX06_9TELE|nr:CD209 antigen-like protein D DC-SIGN-related protein 3 [Takifugu flavidus]
MLCKCFKTSAAGPSEQMDMIDDFDLYENVERPAGHPDRMERCRQCCGHVYEDSNQEVKTPQASFSAMAANGVMFNGECVTDTKHSSEKQLARLVTIYTNLTSQLLTQNREVQQRFNNLSKDTDELQKMLGEWVYFNGSLYQVSSTKKTWAQSRSDCCQKGADLLIINSKEEQAFANRFQKYMWIGLTDVTNEGSWKWVDGTAMSTSYWSSKEPNGGKGENCGDIKNFNAEKSWNDESCSLSLFWICEKKLFQ